MKYKICFRKELRRWLSGDVPCVDIYTMRIKKGNLLQSFQKVGDAPYVEHEKANLSKSKLRIFLRLDLRLCQEFNGNIISKI